ncbi:MAG: hypothetical protein GY754_19050 [bacterium]|nr:hypothetical protein [bacterium]
MKNFQTRTRFAVIGITALIIFTMAGCEAGLTSGSNDGSEEFSFSEMYANISNLKTEINNLKQVDNLQAETANSSSSDLQAQIDALKTLVGMASPTGTIVPFAGPEANIPDGWVLCNGSSVSRDTYNNLFQAIGTSWGSADGSSFNLPNLQGRFLRGLDIAGSIDPGRSVGSYQNDAFQDHLHQWSFWEADSTNKGEHSNAWDTNDYKITAKRTQNTSYSANGRSATETRPKNAAVNYIIKY